MTLEHRAAIPRKRWAVESGKGCPVPPPSLVVGPEVLPAGGAVAGIDRLGGLTGAAEGDGVSLAYSRVLG